MDIKHILPSDIEKTSLSIIRKELAEMGKTLPEDTEATVIRVIHTTADFEYADTMMFSENAVEKALDAIKRGAHIVTDTNMALSGISKKTLARFGGEVHCFMADAEVAKEAKERNVTRAYVSMEKAAKLGVPIIYAIGNAPTALIKLKELMDEGYRPELIIGVPVGFVNVVEAKELIINNDKDVPYIVNRGRKGGSGVAAAICNSLLYKLDSTRGEEKTLRSGFTTGSCAAAAAKAALMMLLDSKNIEYVNIMTPKGIPYYAEIVNIVRDESGKKVTCSVIKDGGDDPDVTTGAYIEVSVSIKDEPGIVIDGGKGVGRVTKPGLDRAVGEAAINTVPRKMIEDNLIEVLKDRNMENTGLEVIVSVPGGEEIAEKTFNPKLGIVGGISILGTTGIVEPMSEQAIVDTIKTEVRVRKAEGRQVLLAAPGNYGITFLSEKCAIDKDIAVMTSNFVYDSVMIAKNEGFSEMIFAGHIGKLVKVAGGIKNTHSKYGDHRMEILTDITGMFAEGKEFEDLKNKLSECVMTDEAVRIITEAGLADKVFPKMASLIKENMENWADGALNVEVIVFSNEYTELVSTESAHEYLKRTN